MHKLSIWPWAIDDFGIYSPDECPPLHYTTPTTSMPIAPSPYPSPAASTVCNYYSDDFDSGFYVEYCNWDTHFTRALWITLFATLWRRVLLIWKERNDN